MRVAIRSLLAITCVIVLAGCRIDTDVAVDVRQDGSGTVSVRVTFDADAVARTPDLATSLRTDDLVRAGWTVNGPLRADGAATYGATKPFRSADELAGVLAEITGPNGYLREVVLVRSRSFGTSTWTFSATVDTSSGVVAFTDAQLNAVLNGKPLGRDQAAIERELGGPLAAMVSASLTVKLPNDVRAEGAIVEDRTARWSVSIGEPAPRRLTASSEHRSLEPLVWAIVAGAAAFVFVVVVVAQAVRRRDPILRAVEGGRDTPSRPDPPPSTVTDGA